MPNCIQDPQHDCFGLAEAEILKHQIESLRAEILKDRKDRKRENKSNKKDHKEFFRRMEFGEKSQALTQNQLAQILQTSLEIKEGQERQAADIQQTKSDQIAQNAKLEQMEAEQKKQGKILDGITEKPAKTYEERKEQIIRLVIAAVVAVILAKIGLSG